MIANHEPSQITAGDRLQWRRTFADYPASTWTLKYYLRASQGNIDITATADGDDFVIDVASADTVGYKAGVYRWQAQVDDGAGALAVIATNQIKIVENFANLDRFDSRTHAQKVLEAIEAALEKRATAEQQSFTVEGRAIELLSIEELVKARDRFRREVSRESGRRPPRVLTRI